jgi:hypothetical protein
VAVASEAVLPRSAAPSYNKPSPPRWSKRSPVPGPLLGRLRGSCACECRAHGGADRVAWPLQPSRVADPRPQCSGEEDEALRARPVDLPRKGAAVQRGRHARATTHRPVAGAAYPKLATNTVLPRGLAAPCSQVAQGVYALLLRNGLHYKPAGGGAALLVPSVAGPPPRQKCQRRQFNRVADAGRPIKRRCVLHHLRFALLSRAARFRSPAQRG